MAHWDPFHVFDQPPFVLKSRIECQPLLFLGGYAWLQPHRWLRRSRRHRLRVSNVYGTSLHHQRLIGSEMRLHRFGDGPRYKTRHHYVSVRLARSFCFWSGLPRQLSVLSRSSTGTSRLPTGRRGPIMKKLGRRRFTLLDHIANWKDRESWDRFPYRCISRRPPFLDPGHWTLRQAPYNIEAPMNSGLFG